MALAWGLRGGLYEEEHESHAQADNQQPPPNERIDRPSLASIKKEWAYLDFTGLDSDQRRVLFPVLFALSELPVVELIKLCQRVSDSASSDLAVYATARQDGLAKILEILGDDFPKAWEQRAIYSIERQMLVSISAVFATTGQFGKLGELGSRMKTPTEAYYMGIHSYTTLLRWEFDESYTGKNDGMAEDFVYDCGYAEQLGFENAKQKCLQYSTGSRVMSDSMDLWTARGFVYPYRDDSDRPNLAIRVHRSTAEKLLQDQGLKGEESLWLDPNVLDDQLYLIQYQ
ncbi:hypothetical protein BJ085DRAFT_30422 [Dimargaris cristalligena]|uniref:Uncharacterized protein n=1 Tax=Dimargaris cristalligena TaxID=215637 RepID=A0A4P9ZK33_9FUNG|nr:hypothetical protein BJ085DRAFT_30422 [Dimargaris cristalligena]|eukprot:RKP33388.1 hypothetical protein BJ085DRAFT_30422 [Dimargaris cristalligena]